MKKIRIIVAALLVVAMALTLVLFAACGGDNEPSGTTPGGTTPGGTTPGGTTPGGTTPGGSTEEVDNDQPDNSVEAKTIYFYTTQGQNLQTVTDIAIERFESKFPGWTVNHNPVGGWGDIPGKVSQDMQAQQQPDLAYCYPDHVATYLSTGTVVNMNKFINSTATVKGADGVDYRVGFTAEEINDIDRGYFEEGYASNYSDYEQYGFKENDLLTLPFSKSTEVLYTNSTAVKAAALKLMIADRKSDAEKFATIKGTTVAINAAGNYTIDGDENGVSDKVVLKSVDTWDQLWEQCKLLKELYPNVTPFGYDSEANWIITMCKQNGWEYTRANGTEKYTFYNEDLATWLEELKGYYQQSLFTTQEIYGAYTSKGFAIGAGRLKETASTGIISSNGSEDDGGIIYCIGSTGGASNQVSTTNSFRVLVQPIPGTRDANGDIDASCISQGPSLVMLTGGYKVKNPNEKQRMTFLFIKELLDVEFQVEFSKQSGYAPVRLSAFDDEGFIEYLEDEGTTVAQTVLVAQDLAGRFFISPAFNGSTTARVQVNQALPRIVKGEMSAQDALKDAYKNCTGSNPSGWYVPVG